jgi:hypothetical protein
MTQAEAAKLVAVLMAAYPTNRATAQTSGIYERMLADLDYPAANAAIERLLATAKWMPTVAEIRETTLTLAVGEQKPGGEAWGAVLKAIGREGYDRKPGVDFVFSDPVTMRCVQLMQWGKLCASENETADRARFIELYDRLAVNERRKQLSESLPAMQRYRAIEATRTEERRIASAATDAKSTDSSLGSAISNVLRLATGGEES